VYALLVFLVVETPPATFAVRVNCTPLGAFVFTHARRGRAGCDWCGRGGTADDGGEGRRDPTGGYRLGAGGLGFDRRSRSGCMLYSGVGGRRRRVGAERNQEIGIIILARDLHPGIVWLFERGVAAFRITCSAHSIATTIEFDASGNVECMGSNQRNISTGTAANDCARVCHSHFKECTIFAIEPARACLEIGYGRRELACARVARGG